MNTQGHWLNTDPKGTPWRDEMLAFDVEIDRKIAIERLGLEIVEHTESGIMGNEVPFSDDMLVWVSAPTMQDYVNNPYWD